MKGMRKRKQILKESCRFVIAKRGGTFGAAEETGSSAPHTALAHVASGERQQCGSGNTGECAPTRPQ